MNKSTSRTEEKKAAIIRDFKTVRTTIIGYAKSLDPKWHHSQFLGSWSVTDLIAHLQGWDWANMEAIERILTGEIPGFYAYYDADWRKYNSMLVDQYRGDDFESLIMNVLKSHHLLIERIHLLSASDIFRDFGVRWRGIRITIDRLLLAEIGDEEKHANQLEEFVSSTQKD